eukprot:1751134-Rhodomonas_salina.1
MTKTVSDPSLSTAQAWTWREPTAKRPLMLMRTCASSRDEREMAETWVAVLSGTQLLDSE